MVKCIGIIPSRYSSTRLPGKPLADICGKPMIQWVYERCMQSKLDEVIVATDDKRVFEVVESFGGRAVMTSKDHENGSSRIGEVAQNIECEYVVNIQGDEPLIDPECINKIVESLKTNSHQVVTLISKLEENIENPNTVKVVKDCNNNAIYFSRYPIPYNRDGLEGIPMYKHIGIYGYNKEFLLQYLKLEMTILEKSESLEQLRILETGNKILTIEVEDDFVGVDTEDDLRTVISIIENSKE